MESKPEEYLRQIRDLQVEQLNLLKNLVQYTEKQEKRRKWKVSMKIMMILLHYIFALSVAMLFYWKVQSTIYDFEQRVQNLVPSMPSFEQIQEKNPFADWFSQENG